MTALRWRWLDIVVRQLRWWRWRDQPWSSKLAIVFTSLAILPLGIVTAYNHTATRDELLRASASQIVQRARGTAGVIDRYLANTLADIQVVAQRSTTIALLTADRAPADVREVRDGLRQVRSIYGFEALFVTNLSGDIVIATDDRLLGRSVTASRFYLNAVAGQASLDNPRYVADAGRTYLHLSAPVRRMGGPVLGVAVGRLDMSVIDAIIAADTRFGGRGEFGVLWDELGITLSHPTRPERRLRPLHRLPAQVRGELVAEGRFGPDTASLLTAPDEVFGPLVARAKWLMYDRSADPQVRLTQDDTVLYAAAIPLRQKRWTYAILMSEEEILAGLELQTRRGLLVALVTGLLAVGLAVGAARWVALPLRRVGDVVNAIAAGDFSRRIGMDQRDEIGRVATAFDAMADAVAAKRAALREHAETLEKTVAERTAALRASEAELRAVVFAIPDLMFGIGRDGTFLKFMSPPQADLLQQPIEFIGRPMAEVLPRDMADRAFEAVLRALDTGEVTSFEYDLMVRDVNRHYEARVVSSGQDEALAIVRDITERKKAEEQLRFLSRASEMMSASLAYEGTLDQLAQLAVPLLADDCDVSIVERGVVQHVAVASLDPGRNQVVRDLRRRYPGKTATHHPLSRVLRTGTPVLLPELTDETYAEIAEDAVHHRLLRTLAPRSWMIVPLVARGSIMGAMSFVMSESGRRYTEADLSLAQELARRAAVALDNARLYRELQDLNSVKDEFLGTVSHELRTPLNAMLGWARLLRTRSLNAGQADRALETIERNARAQAQLIDDLLDVSRIVSGKLPLQVVPVNVASVADAAVDALRPAAEAKEIIIRTDLDRDVTTWGDPNRLQQVFWNLLSNSVKFTPPGGVVEVSVLSKGADVELRVMDTGVGISPDFLPYVFERFRQADSTTTRKHGGLGLGLAIVRHLVELHGGSVSARSDGEDRGATFIVRLPQRRAADIASQASPAGATGHALRPAVGLEGLHILVVDDQLDSLDLLTTLLGTYGAHVTTAASTSQAIAAIQIHTPDVLVADIGMPDEDGYALIANVRQLRTQHQRDIPAIALSAYAADGDRMQTLEAGFQMHMAKPVDPGELVSAIAVLMGRAAPK